MSSTDSAVEDFAEVADAFVDEYRQGQKPSIEEYAARYPEFADQIRDLLPALVVMEKAKSPGESEGSGVGPVESSMIGRHLGDYEILREIGRGGMGVVFEARQISLGRHVALKVMPRQEPLKANQQIRFEREAKAAARLHHTNIVPVFGVGEEEGLCYYVMQYIKGLGLDEVLDQLRIVRNQSDPAVADEAGSDAVSVVRSMLSAAGDDSEVRNEPAATSRASERDMTGELLGSNAEFASATSSVRGLRHASSQDSHSKADPYWRNIAGIGMQVADALQYAHEQGVTHRDIKPSNLLLDVRNIVWVTDFGLAKADDEADITHSGDILGTIRYMPPESFEGQGDARSDLYSLGITLYELATLKPAFSGSGRRELMKKVVSERPEPVGKLAPHIPRDLATIVDKAIEREPKDRYQTAVAMHDDLRRYLNDEPIRARRLSWRERLGRWSRRNRPLAASLLGLIALMILIVIGSVAAAVYYSDQEVTQRRMFEEAKVLAAKNEKLLGQAVLSAERIETARKKTESEAELRRRNLYSANMLNALTTVQGHRGYARTQLLLNVWRPAAGQQDLRGWEWYYIQSLCNQQEYTLQGHSNRVLGISLDAKGGRLASAGLDGAVIIWDLQHRTLIKRLRSPVGGLRCVAWDPQGRYIVAGGTEGMVVWAVDSWKQVHLAKNRIVYGLQWSPDGQWLARTGIVRRGKGRGSEIVVLKPGEFQTAHKLPGQTRSLFALQMSWSADGKRLAYPSDRQSIVWDVAANKRVYLGPRRSLENYAVVFHPSDSNVLLECNRDAVARRLDLRTRKVTAEFKGHTHGIAQCAWHPSGERVATASWDGSVRLWNAETGELLRTINGHVRHAFSLAWTPDGERLFSSGHGRTVKCWRPEYSSSERQFRTAPGLIDCRFTADASSLVAASSRGDLEMYNVSDGRLKMSFGNGRNDLRAVRISPDGKQLVSAGRRGRGPRGLVRLWDIPSNTMRFERETPRPVASVDWSSNGRLIGLGLSDGSIELLDTKLRPVGKSIRTRLQSIASVQFRPGEETLAFGGRGGFGLLRVAPREITHWSGSKRSSVHDLEWSRSGKKIAVANFQQYIVVWDAETGAKQPNEFRNHFEPIYAMSWGPDDRRLLSVDARGTLTLWDNQTGQPTLKLSTGQGPVLTVGWSADGRKIVSNNSRAVVILDATRGYEVEAKRITPARTKTP